MKDRNDDFAELKKARPGSFRISVRKGDNFLLIFAPHAGGIEQGTSEICRWFEKEPWSVYMFEGTGTRCADLHITSTAFDEPALLGLLDIHQYAISFHGMTDRIAGKHKADIFLGGLNTELIKLTEESLKNKGFRVSTNIEYPDSRLGGKETENVTNRCKSKMGMQIEISGMLRQRFFAGEFKKKRGRSVTTELLDTFCKTISSSIYSYLQPIEIR